LFSNYRLQALRAQRDSVPVESAGGDPLRDAARLAVMRQTVFASSDQTSEAARLEAARALGRLAGEFHLNVDCIEHLAEHGGDEVQLLRASIDPRYSGIVPVTCWHRFEVMEALPGGFETAEEALSFVAGVREVYNAL
jgi:hypothetical protein